MADTDADRNNRRDLGAIMRQTREQAVMIPIEAATTLQYPTNGVVPFGMPAALQPTILQGAVIPRMTNDGLPWRIQRYEMSKNVLYRFQKTTWCVTCGHRKAHHVQEERFGLKCLRDYCAKCGWRKEYHPNGQMGQFCLNPSKHDSPQNLWYGKDNAGEDNTREIGII